MNADEAWEDLWDDLRIEGDQPLDMRVILARNRPLIEAAIRAETPATRTDALDVAVEEVAGLPVKGFIDPLVSRDAVLSILSRALSATPPDAQAEAES